MSPFSLPAHRGARRYNRTVYLRAGFLRLAFVSLAVAHGGAAEPLLDLLPQLSAHYRLVLSGMTLALVTNLADIHRVAQQMVKPAARKRIAALMIAALGYFDS